MDGDYIEINVSLHGRHFFATAARSGRDIAASRLVYLELQARFPEREGYAITVTYWQARGGPPPASFWQVDE